ncbi:hypothetical protein DXG03_009319 [Asterophora parasitica]|uniref:STB6-like N-terminal domain-containing protein n=1 Tax=Asterophora parasitica TaxID=117018 RepID=A0A9P7G883_9AGAR|nr:hypothetical protein DXG03_009319 [Asterophora parasitica]
MLSPSRTGSYLASRSPPAPLPRRQTAPQNTAQGPSQLLIPTTQPQPHSQCLGIPVRFHVVHQHLEVQGYQMYAVEKCPSPDLTPPEAKAEWDKALNHLRRDGARPKETPHGVLMATSLAHFRSDFAIVLIPDGNFLAVRERLYTNINLFRMGCSGRSALTLEDPSDATKSRFISTYHLPDNICNQPGPVASTENLAPAHPISLSRSRSHSHSASVLNFSKHHTPEVPLTPPSSISKAKTGIGLGLPSTASQERRSSSRSGAPPAKAKTAKDNTLLIATVLELVKLVQAGLAICGMYSCGPAAFDGLLCDETVDGIRKWIVEIGEPCVGLEPMERIADPMFVAALLSLVLSVRNKLAAIGFSHIVPKDPFLHPYLVTCALTAYTRGTNPAASNPAIAPSPQITHQDPTFLSQNSSQHSHSNTHSTPTSPGHSTHSHASYVFSSPHSVGYMFTPYMHHLVPSYLLSNSHPAPSQLTPSTSGSSSHSHHTPTPAPPHVFLTRELVNAINAAYDAKGRVADGRGVAGGRMRKVLREKLRAGIDSDGDGGAGAERGGSGGTTGGGEGGMGFVPGPGTKAERESLGSVGIGIGVASSGGQILSGIGSFASGLGIAVGAGSGGNATGAGALLEPTFDMAWLVKSVYGKEGKGRGRKAIGLGKGKERKSDAGDLLTSNLGKEKEMDGSVGVSVRALWSGQVMTITRLREWEVEKAKMGASGAVAERKRERTGGRERGALSDGDVDDTLAATAKSETEEESDVAIQGGSFGGIWGEKVQKRLESWRGITKKRGHTSLDLTTPASRGEKYNPSGNKATGPTAPDPLLTARPNLLRVGAVPLSPTLPPTVFGGYVPDGDDDDLLSSGQVSPIDNLRPSPFQLLQDGQSLESTTFSTPADYERKILEFNQKRPWVNRMQKSRISSWADPVSARGILDEDSSDLEGSRAGSSTRARRRKRGDTIGSWLGGESLLEEPEEWYEGGWSEEEGEEPQTLRTGMFGRTRRRSFHDLQSLQGMHQIPAERMRVDVELAGQLLIMTRREAHLQNVLACLRVLTSSLSSTNTLLRSDYQTHLSFLSDLESRTQAISAIDAENAKADKTSQATHTLRYEAEQFRIPDLWHTATPSRAKVLTLREKVFGTGGRRLPQGMHGAHGPFNRLQWTLDGRERLVDHLGRTESEAEEETPGIPYLGIKKEEEEDVVQHPGIKPMWLLRFFTSWGARWGTPATSTAQVGEDGSTKSTPEGAAQGGVKENGNGALRRRPFTQTSDEGGDISSAAPTFSIHALSRHDSTT